MPLSRRVLTHTEPPRSRNVLTSEQACRDPPDGGEPDPAPAFLPCPPSDAGNEQAGAEEPGEQMNVEDGALRLRVACRLERRFTPAWFRRHGSRVVLAHLPAA